jgi:hypothetical protein
MLPPAQSDDSFEVALKWVNDGVGEMGPEEEYDDTANRGLPCGPQRSIYRAVIGEGMSGGLDEIIQHHAAYAESQNLDPIIQPCSLSWTLSLGKQRASPLFEFSRKSAVFDAKFSWLERC